MSVGRTEPVSIPLGRFQGGDGAKVTDEPVLVSIPLGRFQGGGGYHFVVPHGSFHSTRKVSRAITVTLASKEINGFHSTRKVSRDLAQYANGAAYLKFPFH